MSFYTGIWCCWTIMSRCIQELKNLAPCKGRKTANILGCEVCYSIFPHYCQSYNSQIVDPFSPSTTSASNIIWYYILFTHRSLGFCLVSFFFRFTRFDYMAKSQSMTHGKKHGAPYVMDVPMWGGFLVPQWSHRVLFAKKKNQHKIPTNQKSAPFFFPYSWQAIRTSN